MTWRGDYDKQFYDLLLDNYRVVLACWPNAGKMVATDGSGQSWKPGQFKACRVSRFQGRPPSHTVVEWNEADNAAIDAAKDSVESSTPTPMGKPLGES